MKKQKKANKYLGSLMKYFNIGQITQVPVDITDNSYRSISESETKKILKSVYVQDATGKPSVDKQQIPSMLEPIGRELIDRRMDHEKLMSLAPEIEQAAAILIPSILSPNDFRKNIFEVIIEGGNESQPAKDKIVELIKHHFGEELDLSTKLSEWLNDAMFKMGGKAIMILPTSIIGELRDKVGTVECLDGGNFAKSIVDSIEGSVEHIVCTNIKVIRSVCSDDELIDRVISLPAFSPLTDDAKEAEIKRMRGLLQAGLVKGAAYLDEKKLVKFSDDPRMLIKSKLSNSAALEAIDTAILKKLGEDAKPKHRDTSDGITANSKNKDMSFARYNHIPYIDLSDYVHDDDSGAYPAVIELPYESVIPVIVEGSPSSHIGYFVMINTNGIPISAEADNFGDLLNSTSGSQRVNNLYNAFYGSSQFSVQKKMSIDAKFEILNSIYDSFVNKMMHSKLDKMGLDKHSVELTSNISKVMFARLLKNSETRIIFVPKRLMMYLAFQHNPDGTGRSKIDNIKFPLSLKMTLIIVRMISLIESSINRRTLNITLDDGIGNPLELLRSVKKDIISNKMYGITYDPSTIIKSVLDKELTIIPNKIPGVEDFALSDTPNNVEYPKPDDAILDEIKNMYMMSLGVPPSAMNRLSEDEFSRSVASNNIFFSNQLKTYQKCTCKFVTDFIHTYTSFSTKLKKDIVDVLNDEISAEKDVDKKVKKTKKDEKVVTKDKALGDAEDKSKEGETSVEQRLSNVLGNIKFTLPPPTLAQDKANFDELKDYIEIVDVVLTNMFPDDMVSDPDLGATVKVLRANTKREIIKEHIKTNSLLSDLDFDVLENIDLVDTADTTQKLMNLRAALSQLMTAFKAADGLEGDATTQPNGW